MSPTDELPPAEAPPDPAFEARFEAACERVLLYARLRLSPELALRVEPLDVLQETWIEAARSYAGFEERGPGSFERWLCRVAEHRLRDLAKREGAAKRRAPGAREALSRLLDRARASQTGPRTAAERADDAARLERALGRLEPEAREALLLRHFQGATVAEVAARLGRSETAARRLLGRAVAALAQDVGSDER